MHMLPPYIPGDSPYQFREADQPALTKAGWIKSETIGLLTGSETHDDVGISSHPIPLVMLIDFADDISTHSRLYFQLRLTDQES